MKKHIISLFLLACLLSLVSRVNADEGCVTQYGGSQYGAGCPPTDLTINKEVKHPTSGVFVENLSAATDSGTFSPGAEVLFRLTIKNGSGETFAKVDVRDVLPKHFEFVSGPGTYNKDNRTLTFELPNMIAGETRVVEILTKITSGLPTDVSCVTNQAFVSALNRSDEDSAQVCVTSKVLGVSTLPVAGFNDLAILLPFAGLGLTGIALLRRPEPVEGRKKS